MRRLQVSICVLALAAFIVSLFFMNSAMGDALWRAGMAVLLLDLVVLKLWPVSPAQGGPPGTP